MPEDPLHLLCVEPRFPGRLGAVADWLVRRRGYRCSFACATTEPPDHWPESAGAGLEPLPFPLRGVATETAVRWTQHLERGLDYAYSCWQALDAQRPRPVDLVLGRSAGLGSTLFAPVALPGVPIVNLFDHFYRPRDPTNEVDPELPARYYHWRQAANAMDLLDLENGVTPWIPTRWQRDLFPVEYRDDFVVLHDGVDARRLGGRPPAARRVAGRSIAPETRVVSFVARSLDRTRGFDRFMDLANRLIRTNPDVLCIVAGDPIVERGLDARFNGQDYRAHVLGRSPPRDPDRVWFLGRVSHAPVAELLAASDLHVYPSRPHPVSRSLVEAMAAGCVILAWDAEPVREFLAHGRTALLVSPDDPDSWEHAARNALDDRATHRPLGEAAATAARERYDRDVTLPGLARLFDRVVEGRH